MMKIVKRFQKMSAPAKASLVLMLTHLIQKGLSVITTPIYSRLLSTEEYGLTTIFFSWHEIFMIFSGFCLAKGVFNNGMQDFEDDRDCFSWSLFCFNLMTSFIVGSFLILFSRYVWNFTGLPMNLIAFMVIILTFEEALSLWTVRQRFDYKYKAVSILTVCLAVLSPLCGIICILKFPENKVLARICGARTIFVLTYLFIAVYLLVKAKGRVKLKYWKYAFSFNLPLLPHYLSLHILNHMDRIMIKWFDGNSSAGIYSVAYSGASIIKIVWQSINASLIPWTYEKCRKEDFDSLASMTKVLVLGYGLVCITFMFLAPEVMRILAPAAYLKGIYVIPSVTAGVFFSSIYYIFANVVYYYKKPKYVMVGSVVSAVMNVVLNAIFIPLFGFVAAGYTTMVSYIIQAAIDYWAMKKVAGRSIYDMKFIVGISLLMVFSAVILSFIYEILLLRLGLFVAFVCYVIYYAYGNLGTVLGFVKSKGKEKK